MFKSIASVLFISLFSMSSAIASSKVAADVNTKNPYELVSELGNKVFEAVAAAKADNKASPREMELLIEQVLMPHIDVPFASYKILGTHLRRTTREERDLFVEVMTQELKETYSSALAQYENQSVQYEPARDVGDQKMVAVKTTLLSPNSSSIDMTFKLRKNRKTLEWRAYDLVVEGISLIDSKRAELAKPLRDKGIGFVTQLIAE